jgi:2-methylcitrate dehydratase PrpD
MVQSVEVDVVKHTYDRIAFRVPQTSIQGKFCMPYLVARALIDGRVGIDAFTETAVRDPAVLKLAERVKMNLDNNLKRTDLAGRPCRVSMHLQDGRTLKREAQHAKGSPEFPMTEAELNDKFFNAASHALPEDAARRALEQINKLEALESVRPLCEVLRG